MLLEISLFFKYKYPKIKMMYDTSFSFIEKLYRISSRKIQDEKNFHLRTNLLPISWEGGGGGGRRISERRRKKDGRIAGGKQRFRSIFPATSTTLSRVI